MARFCALMAFYDNGSRFRRRNLKEAVLGLLGMPDIDVVVAEQYPEKYSVAASLNNVTYVPCSVMSSDPDGHRWFCKTELLNRAMKATEGKEYDYYMMVDADTLLSMESFDSIRNGVSLLDNGEASILFPFDDVIYMNECDTKRMIDGGQLLPGTKDHGAEIFRQTGLCNIFKKSTWERVGGFDEAFTRWGAEDDAFLTKCKRLVGPSKRLYGTVYHMFHPKTDTVAYRESSAYRMNRKRCACIRRMSDEDLEQYSRGLVKLDTLVEKYESLGRLAVSMIWNCTPLTTLTIDTTLYDLGNSEDMTFTKLFDTVASTDGKWYVPTFFEKYMGGFGSLRGLSDGQRKEIEEYLAKCSS